MKNIVILLSGRGSNMRAIVDACAAQDWPARVVAVISNRADAPALAFARERGIAAVVLAQGDFASREAYDTALAAVVDGFHPDLLVLAGFMRVLGAAFVERYRGRLLNIHPSLLPSFAGLKTHQRALDAGVRVHGATVHFVTAELDCGPIVAQAAVPVRSDDDALALASRVLEAEHFIYPRAVRWFVEGRLSIDGSRVLARLDPPESQWHFATECA
jgi:phosphoribosylglycinamide formyltransferase-1